MALYNLYAGLGGGLGRGTLQITEEFDNWDEDPTGMLREEKAIDDY